MMDAMDKIDYFRKAANYINRNKYTIFFVLATILLLWFFKTIPGTIHRFNVSMKRQKQAVHTIDSLSTRTINPYNYDEYYRHLNGKK
ncbi:MAG TPA: hypothetical protein PLE74_11720 [Candidatus Cloacimonadota bacterium]|nr:hypothetical protein [Candidatus Cloacimonadota bacterium]HPT72932.1 hypothetical protein [Candidatus Cloacimonadota bacterium]